MKKEKRIPTLLGLFLVSMLMVLVWMVENGLRMFASASLSEKPLNLQIVNVSDISFSVFWTTDHPTTGFLKYKENNALAVFQTSFDLRDRPNKLYKKNLHFVNVGNLKPDTDYVFEIYIDEKTYDKETFKIKTGPVLSAPAHILDPSFGILKDKNGKPISEAIVLASFNGSQILATPIQTNGNWTVPLGSLRTSTFDQYFVPTKHDILKFIFSDAEAESVVNTTIEYDSPLPEVILGQKHDFTKPQSRSHSGITYIWEFIAQKLIKPSMAETLFSITQPTENQAIPAYRPGFKGTGTPNQEVVISISNNSFAISGSTRISQTGYWYWTPNTDIPAGKYLVTATSYNSQNEPQADSRNFMILKSGTSVLGDATPSASLNPTPTATPKTAPLPSSSVKVSSSPLSSSSPVATSSKQPTTGTTGITLALVLLAGSLLIFGTLIGSNLRHSY